MSGEEHITLVLIRIRIAREGVWRPPGGMGAYKTVAQSIATEYPTSEVGINRGLRIRNTQNVQLHSNAMTTDHQLTYLRSIQEIVNTPQWMLEVQAEEEGWITDDQHAANAWWDSQSDDIPF